MKLASTLPKGPKLNGLYSVQAQLITDPAQPVFVVMEIDCKKTETEIDTGEVTVTARILSVEPVTDHVDHQTLTLMLARTKESRLAEESPEQPVLPIGMTVRSARVES